MQIKILLIFYLIILEQIQTLNVERFVYILCLREGQVYITGNLTYDPRDSESLIESRVQSPEKFQIAREFLFVPSNVMMSSAEVAYDDVLNFAGVIYPVRDMVDQRIVDDIKPNRKYY